MSELTDHTNWDGRDKYYLDQRIAALEAQLAEAQNTIKRLSTPMTKDEENEVSEYWVDDAFDTIIKRRLAPPTPQAAKRSDFWDRVERTAKLAEDIPENLMPSEHNTPTPQQQAASLSDMREDRKKV
jgi:hypothetical protein